MQISLQKKKESYSLQNFNETFIKYNNKLINQKTWFIHLKLEHHWKKLCLNVMKHIMTSNDQFNDWLSQRDNDIFKYRNNVIAFNIKVIKRCKDLHDDSK